MTLYGKKVFSKIDMEQVVTFTSTKVVELVAIITITKGMELVVIVPNKYSGAAGNYSQYYGAGGNDYEYKGCGSSYYPGLLELVEILRTEVWSWWILQMYFIPELVVTVREMNQEYIIF